MHRRIIGLDIGGTTFSSALFNEKLDVLKVSDKKLIGEMESTDDLLSSLSKQILDFNLNSIDGIGISCPGPLDSKNGIILNTPNLKLIQNVKLKEEIESRCSTTVVIENDANLFALGEWYQQKQNPKSVFGGITLGTGLGFGIIINGEIFSGAHGLAAEYAISPLDHGNWETYVSISGIKKISEKHIGEKIDPKDLSTMAENKDPSAIAVWSEFGKHLGLALSHFINMIDPEMISIGGGISKAFNHFKTSMEDTIKEFSPSYNNFNIKIIESNHKELSSQLGAALLLKTYQKY
tara:strand:- start:1260 stop:2138 length:879 start_codon:yes stop_codon:yes gene_type:complete